jgi:hypothetical protein
MHRLVIAFATTAAIVLAGAVAWRAEAQTSRGAFGLPAAAQNFSPIEKAACGPYRGDYCGLYHHSVCGPTATAAGARAADPAFFSPERNARPPHRAALCFGCQHAPHLWKT